MTESRSTLTHWQRRIEDAAAWRDPYRDKDADGADAVIETGPGCSVTPLAAWKGPGQPGPSLWQILRLRARLKGFLLRLPWIGPLIVKCCVRLLAWLRAARTLFFHG